MRKDLFVTQPDLPPLEELAPYLQSIWKKRILTNSGDIHYKFENQLAAFLGVPYVSLFSNGTLALLASIDVLGLKGNVITTPYSFVATAGTLLYRNLNPVFADIAPGSFNLDPGRIEEKIDSNTSAIMPVHVYGTPCNVDAIKEIADKYNLKVIYDAAHAFGVKINGESILNFGDLSVLSFHATKSFNTFEGGAVVTNNPIIKEKLDRFKNFGFESETIISSIGINAKMNEFQSAVGLLNLKYFNEKMLKRCAIDQEYRKVLSSFTDIEIPGSDESTINNYAYFPVIVCRDGRFSRDELYFYLRSKNIFVRRYFYPVITEFKLYEKFKLPSLSIQNSINASEAVICLPIYSEMEIADVHYVTDVIAEFINTLV